MAQKSVNSDKMLNLGYRVSPVHGRPPRFDELRTDGLVVQVLMKRNSTYIAFVLAGALLGERVSTIFGYHPQLCDSTHSGLNALPDCRWSTMDLTLHGKETTKG